MAQILVIGLMLYALLMIFTFPIICPSAKMPFTRNRK